MAGDMKMVDTAVTNMLCDTTGSRMMISQVVPGVAFYNRLGNRINLHKFSIRGRFTRQSDEAVDCPVRICLVYDKQPNGAWPTITVAGDQQAIFNGRLLTGGATTAVAVDNWFTAQNPDYIDRFVVLMDYQTIMGNSAKSNAVPPTINPWVTEGHDSILIKEVPIDSNVFCTVFNGSTGAITDIQTGNLFLLTCGGQANGNAFNLTCSTRLHFSDQ